MNQTDPEAAIFGALSPARDFVPTQALVLLGLTGVYGGGLAPQDSVTPYAVIAFRILRDRYPIRGGPATDDTWQVKIVTDSDDTYPISLIEEEIASTLDGQLIGATETGPFYRCLAGQRSPIPPDTREGRTYRALGRDYKVLSTGG